MAYWLIKQEPEAYSFADLLREGHTTWDGVRNYQARNNLQAMQIGDLCLFYHSVEEKRVVGVARVTRTAFADPTAPADEQGTWVAVEVAPVVALAQPVTLATVKATPALAGMVLAKNSRLSVQPVAEAEFKTILHLAQTELP